MPEARKCTPSKTHPQHAPPGAARALTAVCTRTPRTKGSRPSAPRLPAPTLRFLTKLFPENTSQLLSATPVLEPTPSGADTHTSLHF